MPVCAIHYCWARARVHVWCIAGITRMCLEAATSGIFKEYCSLNQITYLTTLDFLYYAFIRKKMTKEDVDAFIADVIAKGSKLPAVDIERYTPTSQI